MFFKKKKKENALVFPLNQKEFETMLIMAERANREVFFINERGQKFIVKEKSFIKKSTPIDDFGIIQVI